MSFYPPPPSPYPPPYYPYPPYPYPPSPPQPPRPPSPTAAAHPPPAASSKKKIIWIVSAVGVAALVIVIVIVAVLVYWFKFRKSGGSSSSGGKKEPFHIKFSAIFKPTETHLTLDEIVARLKTRGWSLGNQADLTAAHAAGASWCERGWMAGGCTTPEIKLCKVGYPASAGVTGCGSGVIFDDAMNLVLIDQSTKKQIIRSDLNNGITGFFVIGVKPAQGTTTGVETYWYWDGNASSAKWSQYS